MKVGKSAAVVLALCLCAGCDTPDLHSILNEETPAQAKPSEEQLLADQARLQKEIEERNAQVAFHQKEIAELESRAEHLREQESELNRYKKEILKSFLSAQEKWDKETAVIECELADIPGMFKQLESEIMKLRAENRELRRRLGELDE